MMAAKGTFLVKDSYEDRWFLERAPVTATSTAADALGAADRLGAIAPGYYADVIATSADPLADITALERVTFVMKAGQIIKR